MRGLGSPNKWVPVSRRCDAPPCQCKVKIITQPVSTVSLARPPPHWRRPYSQAIISLILFATRMKIRRSLRKRIAALPNFNCQSVMRERHALDLLLTL